MISGVHNIQDMKIETFDLISGRNSNGTKHSGGPPEDGREKRPKHVGVLYLQTRL
jgi:hypothetical protein